MNLELQINKTDPTPFHYQIRKQILALIKANVLKQDSVLPPETEMAARCKVSRAVIRQALSALANEGYIHRIRGKGTFVLDRSKNRNKNKLKVIGLTTPHLEDTIIHLLTHIVRGAEEEAREEGFNLIISNDADDKRLEREHIEKLVERGVDGLIITYIGERENIDCLKKLKEENVPFVLIDRYTPYLETDYVTTNNFLGAYLATKKLIELNHRKVIHITSDEDCSSVNDRISGFKKAVVIVICYPDLLMVSSHLPILYPLRKKTIV